MDIIAEVPTLDTSSKDMLIELIGKIRTGAQDSSVAYVNEEENYSADVEKP